jgi:S-adenosylmethionine:tRNA ribosyltransferase-isomerase
MNPQPCRPVDLTHLESYDYRLPKDRIAQYPVSPRDASKLLFVNRSSGTFQDFRFVDLSDLLREGDLIVLNDTKVFPARLYCDAGEVLLVKSVASPGREDSQGGCWDVMVYPGKNFKPGTTLRFDGGVTARVLSLSKIGRILQISGDVQQLLERHGKMPLPPYIDRPERRGDRKRYQTIFAKHPGSIAAPTAGFHFTQRVLRSLRRRGIQTARITLHVGPGTFRPVKRTDIQQHKLDPEFYRCSPKTWQKISTGKRIIAVGTTTTRAVETIQTTGALEGYTDLFIYPGYQFRAIKGLITNFHLPKSSLLMLVSAFAGYDLIREAYDHAIRHSYRFYSYGDAMLLL